jgi:hypothetical protein
VLVRIVKQGGDAEADGVRFCWCVAGWWDELGRMGIGSRGGELRVEVREVV